MSQNGRHVPHDLQHHRRKRAIVAVGVVVLVAALGGALVASRSGGDPTVSSPSPTVIPSATASTSTSPRAVASPSAVADGERFVRLTNIVIDGDDARVRVDEAVFYAGEDAFEYAAANGVELEGDYYIDDPSPRLATMPLTIDAAVSYIPEGTCCELQPGSVDGLAASVNGTAPTDYPDPATTWWWATVEDGVVIELVQQNLA